MNETDTTPFPYDRISPELGKFMNVRFRWIADVQNNQLECLLNTESGRSPRIIQGVQISPIWVVSVKSYP